MKKIVAILMCLLTCETQSLEYEPQFENDQVSIAKITLFPHEEIPLHRDIYPQVIVALKGGTITRLEADGRKIDLSLPTGTALFREADPENELHGTVNNSSESIELIAIQLKSGAPSSNKEEGSRTPDSHHVAVGISLDCPMSDELKNFARSIPTSGAYSSSFEEWKSSFVHNMTQLIRLVESEKVGTSYWSVKTDDRLLQEIQDE